MKTVGGASLINECLNKESRFSQLDLFFSRESRVSELFSDKVKKESKVQTWNFSAKLKTKFSSRWFKRKSVEKTRVIDRPPSFHRTRKRQVVTRRRKICENRCFDRFDHRPSIFFSLFKTIKLKFSSWLCSITFLSLRPNETLPKRAAVPNRSGFFFFYNQNEPKQLEMISLVHRFDSLKFLVLFLHFPETSRIEWHALVYSSKDNRLVNMEETRFRNLW